MVAVGFLTIAVSVVFFFEILIVKPYLIEHQYRFVWVHICWAFAIAFNLYACLYRLLSTDSSTQGLVMSTDSLPGWHYCYICEANSPPRAYHCKSCDRCILRRDHHCVFSGKSSSEARLVRHPKVISHSLPAACCVGYKNHKYYMGLLFQVAFGSLYAFFFHSPYIWSNLGGLSLRSFFSHSLPIPFYVFGYIDSWTLLCNFISMLTVIGALFSGGLFAYHMSILVKNQTTYEKAKNITEYNLKNWRVNLSECLGEKWPLTIFVSPLLDSKLPGNGLYFPTAKDHKYTQ